MNTRTMLAAACWWTCTAWAAPSPELADLLQREWAWRLQQSPLLASQVGEAGVSGLDRVGDAAALARLPQLRAFAAELAQIRAGTLDTGEAIDAEIVARQLDDAIAAIEVGEYRIPMTSDSAFYSDLAMLPRLHRFGTVAEVEAYLDRVAAIPDWFDQHIRLLRGALKDGMTPPRVVLEGRERPLEQVLAIKTPQEHPLYAPLANLPVTLPEVERSRLQARAVELIDQELQPAYRRLLRFLTREYIPGARTTLAAHDLPNGEAYYRQQIRLYTTLDLSPEVIHQRGLDEVARIRAEMEQIRTEVGFEGDLAAFFAHLRSAPEFYVDKPDELLRHASRIAKRIDGLLPRYFGTLPRLPYTVAPVPAAIAPYYTAGRYVPAASGSLEPGTYWVNTHDLKSRPLYTLPALTLHEAVPGHHLQIALAEEQGDQPPQRRYSYISAYGEGWALYTEWLGQEMGVYTTPYEHFGRLTYEMWRACRLVVDTGIHAQGWTRQQARDYMLANTALSQHEIHTEVDRYISWPAQALSYKLGELVIRDLRREAETELGADFDLRAFHDRILALGSVPLPILETQVRAWVAERKAAAPKADA